MRRAGMPSVVLLCVVALVGCNTPIPDATTTSRSQANEDFAEKLQKATVGDKTVVANTEFLPVSGVGLVWKLPGTGSVAKAPFREFLEKGLRKQNLNPKEFLDAPDKSCSLVMLSALIPPGARKGDPVDITVTLPPNSDTVSLQGGVLFECEMYPYEQAGNVREQLVQNGVVDPSKNPVLAGGQVLLGQPLLRASGPLIVGRTDGSTAKVTTSADDPAGYRAGMIWGGGRFLEDRPYWFELTDDKAKSARMTGTLAARLNEAFPALGSSAKAKTANAVNDKVIFVRPTAAYRLNHTRFMLVARQVPMVPASPNDPRRLDLEQQLLEPATAIAAAIKLEALGAESTAALRVGLESPSAWVRFASAESLAYLGNTVGSAELAKLAEQHPGLRTHCLTALATLDDGISSDRLVELMNHPDPQLRYGAFVALRSANDQHSSLGGKNLKKNFWLHNVAPDSGGMIHLTTLKRNEVVLFGRVGELGDTFSFPLGANFAASRNFGEALVTVAKVVDGKDGVEPVKVLVRPTVGAVLNALGELGGGYPEAVEFVRRADSAKVLRCAVAIDAAPRGLPVTHLAVLARSDPTVETTNLEVARASRGDAVQAGYDLPGESDGVRAPVVVPASELSRNPGRLFAPKKHPGDGEEPEPAKPADAPGPNELSRTPGRLFGK